MSWLQKSEQGLAIPQFKVWSKMDQRLERTKKLQREGLEKSEKEKTQGKLFLRGDHPHQGRPDLFSQCCK